MKFNFSVIVPKADRWHFDFRPELAGPNGRSCTKAKRLEDLKAAVRPLLAVNLDQT